MVNIHYCPKCKKASREHLFKKIRCRICKTEYDTVNVSRSRYFSVQFIFLIISIAFLLNAFFFTDPVNRIYEFLGTSLIAIAMLIFTLYFQMMDSRDMEYRAEQRVMDEALELMEERESRVGAHATDRMRLGGIERSDEPLAASRNPFFSRAGKTAAGPGADSDSDESGPPRVVRIRRALPGTSRPKPELEGQPRKEQKPASPIVIRDMSQLLEQDEDEEEEEDLQDKRLKMKKKIARKK